MTYCGMSIFANEAAMVFKRSPNVYGDTTWSWSSTLKKWCRKCSPRFMFGTDHANNTGTELSKIRRAGLTPEEQSAFLETTAIEVFGLALGAD